MENTAADSNSESDISDSWAVIDNDSSLEWNNGLRLGLNPPQYDFVKSIIPRSNSSTSELSDEDSIEVVAEDHTDNLSDEGADIQYEECTGTDQLESTENVSTPTCRPTQDLPHYRSQLKKRNHKWRESNAILIAILIMGFLGGLCLGYLWASHSYKPDDSASGSIQSSRALLTKLEDEIQFLGRQLRSTQSLLKSAVSKTIPKLNPVTIQDLHTKTKGNPFKVVYPGMSSITGFITKSQENFSKECCLASDRPQANENGWTSSANNMSLNIVHTSSSSNTSPVKKHLELNTRTNIDPPSEYYTAQYVPYDAKQNDQTFQECNEKAHFQSFDSFQHVNAIEAVPSSDITTVKTSGTTAGNGQIMSNSEDSSDQRPYTKLRTIVERIYAILSVTDNENQVVFPSQVELLSVLPENIVSLDLSKRHIATNVYDKITRSTIKMQDITQKLLAEVDSSITNFVQHIALKIKEIETFNLKQICNLKTIVKSSTNIALLDLDHEPIFKKCVQEDKQNYHNDLIKSEYKNELTGNKDILMVNGKDHIHHEFEYRNENVEQSDTQHLAFESGEAKEEKGREGKRSPKKSSVLSKKHPKVKKNILENKSQLKELEAYIYSDKEIKSKIEEAAKNYKSGAKPSELHVTKKREKSGMKEKRNNKERDYNNESHGKDQKDIKKSSKWVVNTNKTSSNMSGEWALKMAHGRAEQRRRDHQSDWVFERAKSRMSSRRKSVKESYWHNHQDNSSKFFNSGMCNKTMPLKDKTSKRWRDVKQRMKKTLWKPLIDSAKSVKKAFNKFNSKLRYHSHQE